MTSSYLQDTRQRFVEFGGFVPVEQAVLSSASAGWVESVLLREEQGLSTLVALAQAAPEGVLRSLAAELYNLAADLAERTGTEVTGLLVIAMGERLTREQYARWQELKVNRGSVRLVTWVADLGRCKLYTHQGPPFGIDPDLEVLAAPEPECNAGDEGEGSPPQQRPHVRGDEPRQRAPATVALIAINVGVFVLMTVLNRSLYATEDTRVLAEWGAVARPDMWVDHQYWRLFTANFLHIGYVHLAMNMLSLWVVGRLIEWLYGPWRLFFLFLVAGVAGCTLSSMLGSPMAVVAGASAGIFGLLGALIWYRWSSPLGHRLLWRPLLQVLALNLAMGLVLYKFVDNWGHLGGLAGGVVGSFAMGVPLEGGAERPRAWFGRWTHVLLAVVVALSVGGLAAGLVEPPGPGRDLVRAFDALENGRLAEAETGFERLTRRFGDVWAVRYGLAETYLAEGRCGEARQELNRAVELEGATDVTNDLAQRLNRCKS